MKGLIDLHCDTLSRLLYEEICKETCQNTENGKQKRTGESAEKKAEDQRTTGNDLKYNDYCISIPGMQKAGTLAQFFACFTHVSSAEGGYDECYKHALSMMKILKRECEKYGSELAQGFSWEDIRKNERSGKITAILTVEEGGIINGKMERLEEVFRQGVRLITPMWNYENCFGHPNSKNREAMKQGLKAFGKEAVEYAGKLGMIVDVSHASDGSFDDILDCAAGPVIASHSNCRALCDHPRNLTDEMIRRLARVGGIAGINFFGTFLEGGRISRLEAMTAHIQHMLQVGGSEFPAIGTDFDGFDGMEYEDICRVEDIERLWVALKRAGVTESQLDGIWGKNAARVLKRLSVS